MRNQRNHAIVLLAAMCVAITGCGQSGNGGGGGNAKNTGGGGGGTNIVDNLPENPNSLPGKVLARGRDVRELAEQQSGNTAGMANELTGGGGEIVVGGLTFQAPGAWERLDSPRAAEFNVPGARGGANVRWFSGIGGSVRANLTRWNGQVLDEYGQPANATIDESTINGHSVATIAVKGTYMDGPPGGEKTPRNRWAMRGAIIEGPKGNVFIKMVGPRVAVESADAAWNAMLQSVN